MYGLYESRNDLLSPPIHYNFDGNTIYFSGLDVMGAHGERHDIIWGNEAMATKKHAGILSMKVAGSDNGLAIGQFHHSNFYDQLGT